MSLSSSKNSHYIKGNLLPQTYGDIEEALLASFSKREQQPLSLFDLKKEITSHKNNNSDTIKMILLLFFCCVASTGIYIGILSLLGFFNIHPLLSFFLGISGLGFFYVSGFGVTKILNKIKLFPYQREVKKSKSLFEKFLNSDNQLILNEIKNNLLKKLDNTKIQKYNLFVYDFIFEGISHLDGKFNKLKYEIDNCKKTGQYSLEPFRTFFNDVESLEVSIEHAKDIKVINE